MQMCACLKKHMRVDYVFCALCMVCPGSALTGIVKAATGKACNECKPGLWSRKSRHPTPTPTPGNFDHPTPTPTPTPDRLRPSAVLVT